MSAGSIKEILKNQLTIVGALVSNNTYGGSVGESPFLLGDGSQTDSTKSEAEQKAEARLFDINFLRYAKTITESSIWGDTTCWADDVKKSQYFGDDCDSNNPDSRSIVNIIYQAPTNKMPVFNAVK
ncbi:hypothetical protein HZC21_01410 [Candidatus Peregrinibacteria bacterium]|nr:hypothetical protein [Candidatus Peregrinibacteria bacterium]